MKNMNKLIGNHGEDIAANYYLNNGYTTLDRNFLIKKGELDLIVKKDDVIVFVEVKSRSNNSFGTPCESVTFSKQKNIKYLSKYYLTLHNLYNYYVRYDVAEIYFNYYDNSYKLNIISDAFR